LFFNNFFFFPASPLSSSAPLSFPFLVPFPFLRIYVFLSSLFSERHRETREEREADWERERDRERERPDLRVKPGEDHRRSDFRWSLLEKPTEERTQNRNPSAETRPSNDPDPISGEQRRGFRWIVGRSWFPAILAGNPATSRGDFRWARSAIFRWFFPSFEQKFAR